MISDENKKEEFFESIAPKVQSAPVMLTTNKQIKRTPFGFFGLWFLVLFLAAAGALIYYFPKYQEQSKQLADYVSQNQLSEQAQNGQTTLDRLAKHIMLPEGQVPAVAAIEDAQGLKNLQPLYANVKDGDQLITYKEIQIVYDPMSDKIVYVRPLAVPVSTASIQGDKTEAPSQPAGSITLDIRNGAGLAGLAGQTAAALGKESTYNVVNIGNAQKSIYTKTVIVNLANKDVSNLETRFGVKAVTEIPLGEEKSTADVILILGR